MLFAATASASAHGASEDPLGLLAGLKHPFYVPAHMLALAALGLRLGQNSLNQVIYAVIVFGLALIAGLLATLSDFFSPYTRIALLSVTIIVGLLTLIDIKKLPFEITVTSIIVALMIGIDSGVGAQDLSTNLATLSGSAITTFTLYTCWTFLTLLICKLKPEWIKIGIRVIASWITAIAAMVISLFFATFGSGGS